VRQQERRKKERTMRNGKNDARLKRKSRCRPDERQTVSFHTTM
jgi:hypothetical protein